MLLKEKKRAGPVPVFGRLGGDGAPRLLIVDDTRVHRMILARMAEKAGFQPVEAGSVADVIRVLSVGTYDGATVDLSLGEQKGTAVFQELVESDFSGPVVVVSGSGQHTTQAAIEFGRSLGLDMRGSIPKPVNLEALRECFADMIRK